MELHAEIVRRLGEIDWFRGCGTQPPSDLPFHVKPAPDAATAIQSALGSLWRDARTEAQGDLTAYLAKNHPEADCFWNELSTRARERIQGEVMPIVNEALGRISAESLWDVVLLDLNRIAIHSAYRKRFRRLPDFYERLLIVYERGHLPCGWVGDFDSWPEGQLLVY